MDGPAGEVLQHLGPHVAHLHHLLGDVRGRLDDAHDVAHRVVGVGADDEVRRRQEVEVEDLVADVGDALHQAAEFHRRGGRRHAEAGIGRLAGGQVMGPGADAADVADDPGHFLHRAAFAEFLKAAQRLDVHLGIADVARIIQRDGHLGVAFDPGYRLNIDNFSHNPHPLSYRPGR